MKKFRPYNAGYLLIYALTLGAAVDAVYTLISMQTKPDSFSSNFGMWSFLILLAAGVFTLRYSKTMIEIGQTSLRCVRMILIQPKPGTKRANFLFRQGEMDNVLVDTKFELDQLEKYGYVEAFGLKNEDKSGASPKNKLFPLHEVAFILRDGSVFRVNAAIYSRKQLREMLSMIREKTNLSPTGELANALAA